MKKEVLPKNEVLLSITANQQFCIYLKNDVNCQEGQGMKIIKFHLSMHTPKNILDFGVTANVDTGPAESNHKKECKATLPVNATACRAH